MQDGDVPSAAQQPSGRASGYVAAAAEERGEASRTSRVVGPSMSVEGCVSGSVGEDRRCWLNDGREGVTQIRSIAIGAGGGRRPAAPPGATVQVGHRRGRPQARCRKLKGGDQSF